MAGFLKIRYNANGLLKNRIINTDSIDIVEPFSGPGGRYVEETRSRIFMKDGTKYDMSLTVDEIQKLLREAGVLVAEIQSTQPERQVKVAPLPPAPVSLYKRSTLAKPPAEGIVRKSAEGGIIKESGLMKQVEGARKQVEAVRR